jgi:RNA polymerase sigma-70 factor, ECF subfamily
MDALRAQKEKSDAQRLAAAMERYAVGDEAAFDELYDLLAPRLFAYLLQRTRDRSLSEDLVQRTLLQMHQARGSYVAGAGVLPWVLAIARHLLIDHARHGARERAMFDRGDASQVASRSATADELVEAHELATSLEGMLQALPTPQRVALELVKARGLSLSEAAARLKISVGALKLRLHRAQRALRTALCRS